MYLIQVVTTNLRQYSILQKTNHLWTLHPKSQPLSGFPTTTFPFTARFIRFLVGFFLVFFANLLGLTCLMVCSNVPDFPHIHKSFTFGRGILVYFTFLDVSPSRACTRPPSIWKFSERSSFGHTIDIQAPSGPLVALTCDFAQFHPFHASPFVSLAVSDLLL